ncbi:MAG TPA: BamA/TamA family outer membrane protein [Rhodothermales bacterium]
MLIALAFVPLATAQVPLMFVNEDTEVRKISFNFVTTKTFEEQQLQEQLALTEPGFWDKVKEILPLMSASPHPFDPVVLQKDVVRLRQYYNRNGFLHPDIDYPASQLDTSDNEIHVVFKIDEGPPVIIQDVSFVGPDGSFAFYQFPGAGQDPWIEFRNDVTVHTGDRYTDFDRIRIQDEALTWLKDRGFAFADVDSEVQIDSIANTADLRFVVDTGPLAYIDSIRVEGNESVSRRVVVRELPFKEGQRFRNRRLIAGQRELFQLNLFRLALVEVPEQPRDTSVTVSVRVREAFPRYVNAQTGYGREAGATLEGQWSHRNFFGGAREFSANLLANTGYFARLANQETPARLFRGSVSLRQPYLFVNRLSGLVSPFMQFESDPLLQSTTDSRRKLPLDINVREYGLNTTLIYEMLPFRTISLQHSFSRAQFLEFSQSVEGQTRDRFNKSIFSLSAVLGKTNDYVRPTRGYLIRPFAEFGGQFLASDINYVKYGAEATYHKPLLPGTALGLRLYFGRMELLAGSQYDEESLFNSAGRIVESELDKAILENRFDRIRFYAGGGNDVRGWNFQQIGPQVVRVDSVFVDEDGEIQAAGARTEALGGLAQLSGNVEMRLPFPGLGPAWTSALFFDFGQVYQGPPNVGDLKYAVGAGMRYETLVGFIRLDVGFKLNPSLTDLNTAEDIYLYRNGLKYDSASDLPNSFMRRFAIHFSIGQAF